MKVLLNSFHLNGHTLGFYPQAYMKKLDPQHNKQHHRKKKTLNTLHSNSHTDLKVDFDRSDFFSLDGTRYTGPIFLTVKYGRANKNHSQIWLLWGKNSNFCYHPPSPMFSVGYGVALDLWFSRVVIITGLLPLIGHRRQVGSLYSESDERQRCFRRYPCFRASFGRRGEVHSCCEKPIR